MPIRICPTCSTYLGEFDSFFCSNCGAELPENLGKLPGTIKIREYNSLQPRFNFSRKKAAAQTKPEKKPLIDDSNSITAKTKKPRKTSFNQKMALILFIVVIGLIAFFGAFYFYLKARPVYQPAVLKRVVPTYNKTVNITLSSKTVNFDTISATDYAPADSLFYAEIADFGYFHENLLSSELLNMNVGDYVKLKGLVKQDGFSLFAFRYNGKVYWTAVFIPTDKAKLTEELKTFKSTKFKARIIEDKLVVFQNNASENVIKTVEGAKKGQVLKISLNPDYVKAISQLNPNGQIRVILLNGDESSILIKDLSKKYFGSKGDFFAKLLNIKESAFVVSK